MTPVEISLRITSQSSIAVGAGGSAGARVDRSIVRDAWGRPTIPGSQLKGRLRHAAEQILRALDEPVPAHFDDEADNLIRAIFGSPEHASPLFFHDLPCDITPATDGDARNLSRVRPSVALSRRRRTAEESLLMIQEVAAEGLVFAAERAISGALADERHLALLWAALRLTDRWGGGKSRGLGWSTLELAIRWGGQPYAEATAAGVLRRLKGGR